LDTVFLFPTQVHRAQQSGDSWLFNDNDRQPGYSFQVGHDGCNKLTAQVVLMLSISVLVRNADVAAVVHQTKSNSSL